MSAAATMEETQQHEDAEIGAAAKGDDKTKKKTSSVGFLLLQLLTIVFMGLCFGTAFTKSRVFEPTNIRGQFLFKRFVMLKMFFGAMGVGSLCLAAASKLAPDSFAAGRKLWEGGALSRGWLTGAALGGFILGAGMATAGACPGMVYAQVGSLVTNCWLTLLGGFVGALSFGLLEPVLSKCLLKRGPQGPQFVYIDMASKSKVESGRSARYYLVASLGLGVGCLAAAAVLEVVVPFQDELRTPNEPGCSVSCQAWPPSVAGGLLGLMQLPAILLLHTFLGTATSFQVISSAWIGLCAKSCKERWKYMALFSRPSIAAWWQIPYVLFAMVSAYLLAFSTDDLGKTPGVSPAAAFVGGFLMIFGSRMAGGCTSGHGLSGCPMLMAHSWVAVPTMFAGGIATAMVWYYVDPQGFFPPSALLAVPTL